MKRVGIISTLCLLFFTPFLVSAYQSPGKPQGFVSDFAGILSPGAKSSLESSLSSFQKETSLEIAVVTIPSLGDETIETYAVKLFEEWGIGDKEKDTGALLLVAPNERKVRIEVGYGLEGSLTDAQSNGIIQTIVLPAFRANDYEKGITEGARAMMEVVRGEGNYVPVDRTSDTQKGIFYFIQHFGFIILFIVISIFASTKSWWLGGILGAGTGIVIGFFSTIFIGVISTVVLTLVGLLVDYLASKGGGRGGRGGFWGGFGGGSFGGGGFGGFSGGSSGGGGSSGSW